MPSAPRATPPGAQRRDRRDQARALRREREAAEARAARIRQAWRDLARVAIAALAVVAVLVVIGETTREDRSSGATATTARQTVDRFAGIRQSGYALGSPNAPVTVVEFADMQCPFCADFDREVLPTVLQRYVRTGKVRIELRTMAFLGEDSVTAAKAVAGAAAQNRAWQFVDRFYHRQGRENSGYVTEDFLRATAAGIPGLNADRVIASDDTAGIQKAQREAQLAGVNSTPSFLVGKTGGTLKLAELRAIDAGEFSQILDRALGR